MFNEIPARKTVGISGAKLSNYLESRLKTKALHRFGSKALAHFSMWKNGRLCARKTQNEYFRPKFKPTVLMP